ncbi:MAG: EAL domain-containing protein [Pseudomonadota bacterium]
MWTDIFTRKMQYASIKSKLRAISLLAIITAMLVLLLVMLSYEFYFFRQSQATELSVQSHIVGDNSAAALAFSDPDAAKEVLSALHASPSIDRAGVFLQDGTLFAIYNRLDNDHQKILQRPAWNGIQYSWSRLVLSQEINFKGKYVGQLVLEANFDLLHQHILLYGCIALLAVLAALFFAMLLLRPLIQSSITQPILSMNRLMQHVSSNIDYSARIALVANDELGELASGLNVMLERIQYAGLREKSRGQIMEMLATGASLPKVLEFIVMSVEHENKNMLCSICMLDDKGQYLYRGVAPSLPEFYNNAINGIEVGMAVGSCGTAAFTGERVIVEDIQTHPYWELYKELAARAEVAACWSQPIHSSAGKVLGTFAIYYREAQAPTESDIAIIEQSASLASIAIEREQREAELKVAAIAFEAQEGMMVTDSKRNILRVNRAFTEITGYSAEEVIGYTPRLFSSDRHEEDFYTAIWQTVAETGTWDGEIWNRRKSGEVYPEHMIITAVKDASGAITNYVATLTDITTSKAASIEIENLAFYDPLTHLANRRLLLDRLKQALAVSTRSGQSGALLFLDLDHFKILNDTLGHDVGDLLLKEVAKRLTACVREGDTVARLGGDEYVVLLENLSELAIEAATQAETIGEKILLALNQPYQLSDYEHYSTPSIGATLFNGHDLSTDELLKQADIAMYQAKAGGRNALRFYDPKMQEAIAVRVELEHELRKALELQQFELYYQVQVGSSGQPLGAEALIRWIHPERGIVSPVHFIPMAEETSLIIPIGQWVLDTACAQLALWQHDALTRDLVLAVNVSAKQFLQAGFVEQVQETLLRHGTDPTRLKLELTESLLVDNTKDIIATMTTLGKLGVQFSLDDFGTGYSSLQYLKALPLNQLKIDKSFVQDIATDDHDKAIVLTIIAMAHSLDLSVIAEGVETVEQQLFLKNSGCTHYQGYLFSRPLPIDAFEALLRKSHWPFSAISLVH